MSYLKSILIIIRISVIMYAWMIWYVIELYRDWLSIIVMEEWEI